MNRRARVGVAGLILCAMTSAVWQLGRAVFTREPNERFPALVADYDSRRFTGLTELLPPGGVIGYVTNDPDNPAATRAYYLAQYVLAPCILVRGEGPEMVLVDDRPDEAARPPRVAGQLVRDWGNGVKLYVREGPR